MKNRFFSPFIVNQTQPSTFQTLLLPSPHTLPPLNHSSSFSLDTELPRCFESLPSVSLQLESFPIDNALSKFFSDVLPRTIDTGNGVIPIAHSSSDSEENMCITEKGNMQILMEALQNENNFETTNPTLIAPYLHEIQESVYSIEDFPSYHHVEQKPFYSEDTDLSMSGGHLNDNNFPLLEVDEISIGNLSALSLDGHLLVLLENNEMANGAQNDHCEVSCQELLRSAEIGILDGILDHDPSKLSFELHLVSLNVPLEIDILHVIETSYTQGDERCCANSIPLPVGGQFEEFKMLDFDTFNIFEIFSVYQATNGVETCDQLFQKDMNFQNFNNLIVCHELAMVDDTFKSFPVPVLGEAEEACPLHAIVADMLTELEPQPISASDKIYLDWHFLENDKCNWDFNATCQKVLNDMDPYIIDTELQTNDGSVLLLDFVLSGENLNCLNTEESKLNMISDGTGTGVSQNKLWNADHKTEENVVRPTDTDPQSVSLPDKYVSQLNDLEFFLNPRKISVGRGFDTWGKTPHAKALLHGGLSEEKIGASCSTTGLSLDIKLHAVTLSADIMILMDSLQNRYLAILEDDLKLAKREFSHAFSDDINLLSLPEEKLMDCMGKASGQESSMGYGDNSVMTFGALCAIKRMAWCLSFYGIHTLHLFMEKLLHNLECLKSRLSFLEPLIEDAHRVADKEITKSHPSLALVRDILLLNSALKSKILIVADQDLWWPLKRLLDSMDISVNEVQDSVINGNKRDASNVFLFSDNRKATSLQSDCLLASHELISASDLLNKFDIILEYGGPCGSSRISAIYHKSCGSLQLHFLKVELDGVAKALCVGVGTMLNGRFTMKLEELLDFSSIVEKCNLRSLEAAGKISSCTMCLPANCLPVDSGAGQQIEPLFPDNVIIVNTQNFHKEMIISRQSTYQKILAMEKDGAQVVERDLDLPVDIIISAATSLAWYDCRNIAQNATIPDEASSTTPLCIDSLAADVLTSLSFKFSSCILVFEGESKFLATIMESSDELYAAAASLGLDLQIFCSYSSKLTDEIILSCIGYATKFGKGLYPKLPESESLAESFLTRLPSINPLSAHAILSTVGMLVEFLEWSKECRVNAVQRYLVPEEAINLLSVLCRYGELEDSKSGMTDCSSSVSSAPISGNIYCKFNLERQKKKCTGSSDEAVELELSSRHIDGVLHCPVMSKSLALKSPGKSNKRKLADLSLDHELFDQEQRPDALSKISPLVFEPNITLASKGPQIVDCLGGLTVPLTSTVFCHKQNSSMTPKIKLDLYESNIFQDLHENSMGEVIDIDDKSFHDQDFSFIKTAISSPFVHGMEKEPRPKDSRAARRLLFENITYPDFPGMAGNENDHMRTSLEDNRPCRADIDCLGVECLEADSTKKSAINFHGLLLKEKDTCRYGVTPLSKAISSTELQRGSPWTIEFLNRIRERSRLHKQSLSRPHDSPVACFGYSGNNMEAIKRKSPSILDCFKYQGGSTSGKLAGRKRKIQYMQPSTLSKNVKSSASLLPSWTPADKKARRTLSFAMSGSGSQTKLVWSDKDSQSLGNMKA
ncbi:hypothetical protein Ancab_009640 [Ancistrocladus abbreviatus]